MGVAISHLIPCLTPPPNSHAPPTSHSQNDIVYSAEEPLDETLGHSFCYLRSSARFLSPTSSDRFISPPSHSFRAISGAAVSANSATPTACADSSSAVLNGFDCTSSFTAIPLQPVPRGNHPNGHFLSGPIELGAMSGPLDFSAALSEAGAVPFSAPLSVESSNYKKKRRRNKSLAGIKRTFHRSFSEKKQPWVVPVGRKEAGAGGGAGEEVVSKETEVDGSSDNVQWALGKAGEDRVHVVVSEEHGWMFVGIYDGFNGPDAPEFLMGHLYRALFHQLKGLFWDNLGGDDVAINGDNGVVSCGVGSEGIGVVNEEEENGGVGGVVKRVTFLQEVEKKEVRRKLWEYLADNDAEDGLDLSGSDRFAFSVDDAVRVSNVESGVSRRSLLLSKLKQGWSRSKDGHCKGGLFNWRFKAGEKEKVDVENRVEEVGEGEKVCTNGRTRKTGPVDHELVLRALGHALEKTEHAYLDLTDRVIDRYPELALMGSCLLAVLMRNEDVYVMNLGDSRAIVAQFEPKESCSNGESKEEMERGSSNQVDEECTPDGLKARSVSHECPLQAMKLTALQLSTDHSTSIEEEVKRIKREHPDDNHCIVNDRVKGRLKVTRAFGAGFLKQAKFNDSLLEMFRNEFIGSAPYVSCIPSLRHHQLGPRDQFLVLSSDGLYQYFSNQEVVSFVENFLEKYPDGDPAQHLIEELLNRAAKKAGMDFHDLLDIPQGDRRKYHDDVTVMVISLEGRIWKSSGKYP
ncbi:protein phosphatase 2C 29-like [Silene latifolia]|uniref:protein phosphatase 2C 29-like n=1 Tax=Silene latifolia TaxID=37657 RepID=UPI003D76C805